MLNMTAIKPSLSVTPGACCRQCCHAVGVKGDCPAATTRASLEAVLAFAMTHSNSSGVNVSNAQGCMYLAAVADTEGIMTD